MALGLTPQEILDQTDNPLLNVKEDWERIEVKYIAKIQNGFAFKSSKFNSINGVPIIRIRDVGKDDTNTMYDGDWKEEFLVTKGDMLIGMDGDFRCEIWRGKDALLNQRVCRIFVDDKKYNNKFFFYVLQPFLDEIHKVTSAVTVKHLSSRTIQNIPLPNPPLSEQKAIVVKIEELFGEIDKGVAELKTAQEKLRLYRQSVLKSAFEGEYDIGVVGDVILEKQYGTSQKANENPEGIPVLRMGNIQDGKLDYEKLKYLPSNYDEIDKYLLDPDDILFNRTNSAELVGKSAIYKSHHPKSTFASYLIRVLTGVRHKRIRLSLKKMMSW